MQAAAVRIVSAFANAQHLNSAQLFLLLATPAATLQEARSRLSGIHDPCAADPVSAPRDAALICRGPTDATVRSLISSVIVPDWVLQFTQWMLMASHLGVFVDGNEFITDIDELFARAAASVAANPNAITPGEDIARKTLLMLDAAVASYRTLYGDALSLALAEQLGANAMGQDEGAVLLLFEQRLFRRRMW